MNNKPAKKGNGNGHRGLHTQLTLLNESCRISFTALRGNKLRTGLTLLGIIIGVSTVVSMASVLAGLDKSMADSLASLGSGSIFLTKHEATIQMGGQRRQREKRPDLTRDDAEAIAQSCPSVAAISPMATQTLKLEWGGETTRRISVTGAGEDYLSVEDRVLAAGRFFTRGEVIGRQRVCVLGTGVTDVLFGPIDPIGRQIKIGASTYQVIGTLTEKGNFLGNDLDQVAVVPVATLQLEYGWGQALDYILIQPKSPKLVSMAKDEVEALMRSRRGLRADLDNNFGLTTQQNLMEMYNNLTRAIYGVMLLISGIALAVGGIGIMNMMLVSVKERTREIGIRRAVGARKVDIRLQFMTEAITLTCIGGLAGVVSGGLFALIVAAVSPLPAAMPLSVVLFALGLAISVGLFFGIYPAWRASQQDPIEALHYE
jgi:putative ABC transport system permease protein